jgi:hypothetical protein
VQILQATLGVDVVGGAIVGTLAGHVMMLELDCVATTSTRVLVDVGDASPANAHSANSQLRCRDLRVQTALEQSPPKDPYVSGLSWLGAASAVGVGLRAGVALVITLPTCEIALRETLAGAATGVPVTHLAYQALPDDTLAFVWVASGCV